MLYVCGDIEVREREGERRGLEETSTNYNEKVFIQKFLLRFSPFISENVIKEISFCGISKMKANLPLSISLQPPTRAKNDKTKFLFINR